MTLRVLIVDDEAPARDKVRRMLAQEDGVDVVGEATDGHEAVRAIRALAPDLVFLDVQMPGLDGLEVVGAIGAERMPHVVFVTAFDAHAISAFEIGAVDYLLKPWARARFRRALDRARTRLAVPDTEALTTQLASLIERSAPRAEPKPLERLTVEVAPNREILLEVDRIDVFRAAGNDVRIVMANGDEHRCRGPLHRIEQRLDRSRFLRINRSEIVRLAAVAEMQPWFRGDYRVVLRSGDVLSWSRRYRARDRSAFQP